MSQPMLSEAQQAQAQVLAKEAACKIALPKTLSEVDTKAVAEGRDRTRRTVRIGVGVLTVLAVSGVGWYLLGKK
jgi:hypothetical protein